MELRYKYRFNIFRFLNEVFLLGLSFTVSFVFIRYWYKADFILIDLWMLPLLVIGWYFSSRSTKATDDIGAGNTAAMLYQLANKIFVQFCLVILFFFSAHQTLFTNRFLLIYILLLCILMPIEKVLYKKTMIFLRTKGVNKKKILVIGAGKIGMEFSNVINKNEYLGYEILGFLDDEEKTDLPNQYLGKISQLEEFIVDTSIPFDEVVVALPNSAHNKIKYIADIVGNHAIRLRIIPAYHELINSQYSISIFNGFPMITNRHVPLDDANLSLLKRVFDIIFSSFILLFICSWLFPIIALLIKIDSKGPIIFTQERWGKKNRKIKCYKFRSMATTSKDVDKETGKYKQAQKNDSRITKIGRILRKTSLDELPQFINVLSGDMSVIGPRPHPTPLNLESKEVVEKYLVRHLIKPGITGWAQVNGFRGQTADSSLMKARVNYDIWYIENWSLLLDIKIIFLTLWGIVAGDKNAF